MKKLLAFAIVILIIGTGCSDNELIETSKELEKEAFALKKKTENNRETTLFQKAYKVFHRMLELDEIRKDLSLIISKKGIKQSNLKFKGNIVEDHFIMTSDNIFEDDVIISVNSSFEQQQIKISYNSVYEDNIMVDVSLNVIQDDTAMLIEDFVSEDHVVLSIKGFKDYTLPNAYLTIRDDILKEKNTFENVFNSIYNSFYPEDKIDLNYILDIYPNLFFTTNTAYFLNSNSSTSFVVRSTPICNGNSNNLNSTKITLIDNATGNNMFQDFYFRNSVSTIELLNIYTGVTEAIYYNTSNPPSNNLTLDSSNNFLVYNSQNPIPNNTYMLVINYKGGYTPSFGGTNYFNIKTKENLSLIGFLHNTSTSNLDLSLDELTDYYTHANSNFNHYISTRFRPNEPITFNPLVSKGVRTYSLTLTEISSGVSETINGIDMSTDGYVINLKTRFNMNIGINPARPLDGNHYRLVMSAIDCAGNLKSKTFDFWVSNSIGATPLR